MRRAIGAGALVVATAVVAPPAANAGTYHLYSCRTPAGGTAPLDGWRPSQAGFTGVTSSCASGGFYGVTLNEQTSVANPVAQIEFVTGEFALQVSAVRLFRSYTLKHGGSGGTAVGNIAGPPGGKQVYAGFDFEDSQPGQIISRGTSDPFDPFNKLEFSNMAGVNPGMYAIQAGVGCVIPGPDWPGCGGTYSYAMYSAELTITDSAAPTVGAVGGDLFTDGTVSGTRTAYVLGSDAGAGVFQSVLEVDGKDVETVRLGDSSGRCITQPRGDGERAFLWRKPCPASGSMAVKFDTGRVADGLHKARLLIEDAAGNRTVAAAGDLLVKNSPDTGPGSPVEFRGRSNGSVGDPAAAVPDNAQILMAIEVGPPKKCRGKRYTRKHPVACSGRRPAVRRSYSSKLSDKITGRLQTADGVGITGATLNVTGTPHGGTAGQAVLGNVTTNEGGYFEANIVRNLSMDVVVSWKAREADSRPAASQKVALQVESASTLHAASRSKAGKRQTFTGRLVSTGNGAIGIPAGVPVQMQVRYGGRWSNIGDAASTDPQGRWKVRYRWPKGLRGKGRVRAQVLPAPGFPYLPSKSRTRVIRITR